MCCSRGWCTPVLSTQLLQQCLRLLEVGRVKPLGEPAVERRQQRAGFGALALLLPQARAAHRRSQLQRPGLLAAGHVEGLVEIGAREAEEQLPLEPRSRSREVRGGMGYQ